jgi:hypothetical protein
LKNDPAASKALHDEVTRATKDMAVQAGDVGHLIYLGGQDARDFLGIDEWKSAEAFQQERREWTPRWRRRRRTRTRGS